MRFLAIAAVVFGMTAAPALAPGPSPLKANRDALAAQLTKERAHYRADRRRLVRIIRHRTDVPEAIRLAAFTYGVDRWRMVKIAFCESRLDPGAVNGSSHASGLMQFLPSTWSRNPYGQAGFSAFDPYAAALGAARHASHYGWGAWECA